MVGGSHEIRDILVSSFDLSPCPVLLFRYRYTVTRPPRMWGSIRERKILSQKHLTSDSDAQQDHLYWQTILNRKYTVRHLFAH